MAKSRIEKAVNRRVPAFCLKCGESNFVEETSNLICVACGAKFSREKLKKAAFEKARPGIEKKVVKAVQKEIKGMLKKTFRNNPHITIK